MKKSDTYRNLFKNSHIFWETLHTDKAFSDSIFNLVEKWQSTYMKKPMGFFFTYKHDEIKKKNALAYSQRVAFVKSLHRMKSIELKKDIDDFLHENNLGQEWSNTLADLIISWWFYPPTFNLYIKAKRSENNKERITLTLNPDTSIDDITEAWGCIKKQQKELWPNFKRPNFSKASIRNLSIALKDIELRMMKSKTNMTLEGDEWQKYVNTDLDLVANIWEDADSSNLDDKRRVIELRTIRKRFKIKIK